MLAGVLLLVGGPLLRHTFATIRNEARVKIPLSRIAHTRSGDKGDACNIGVIAYDESHYPILLREVTAERVKRHFGDMVKGEVERYELPNLCALNFILHQALGGGGTVSLRTDAQGKTFGAALLGLKIEAPEL
jgi:hypothetical protein